MVTAESSVTSIVLLAGTGLRLRCGFLSGHHRHEVAIGLTSTYVVIEAGRICVVAKAGGFCFHCSVGAVVSILYFGGLGWRALFFIDVLLSSLLSGLQKLHPKQRFGGGAALTKAHQLRHDDRLIIPW